MVFTAKDRMLLVAIAEQVGVAVALGAANLALEDEQMANIDELRREVEEQSTVIDGAVAAIDGLKQQVADALASAGVDQGTIDALTAQIDAQTNKLAQAIAANTDAGDEVHSSSM